jgi:cytochrome b
MASRQRPASLLLIADGRPLQLVSRRSVARPPVRPEETIKMQTSTDTRVWDLFVRVFHWSLVAAFFTAYFTEDDWLGVHLWAGYLALSLVLLRTVWGFVGSSHARFHDFVYSPRRVLVYFKEVARSTAPRFLGHNPAGGAMVVALMLAIAVTAVTGTLTYGAAEPGSAFGPMAAALGVVVVDGHGAIKEIHELCANLTVGLVAVHVGGVLYESWVHRESLVVSMLTGRKRA